MAKVVRIAVLTTGRQDYGILRSTLHLLHKDRRFELLLWAGGMHLAHSFGHTVELITAEGLPIHAELDIIGDNSDPAGECSRMISQIAAVLRIQKPDALLLMGDRYETLAAGIGATLQNVPIAHLHGGEESEGSIDNAMRHALSKLSHLHLVSHEVHRRRLLQMGESSESVIVVGAPGLDNLYRDDLPDRSNLESALGATLAPPVVIVTYHPTTLGGTNVHDEITRVSAALNNVKATYVITQPNSDPGGDYIRYFWQRWALGKCSVTVVNALGERRYWGLLRIADVILGNSSSGLIEAPAAGVPVVNIGDRQLGRLRPPHVVDVPVDVEAITRGLEQAILPTTKARVSALPSLYPVGPAAPRIIEALANWQVSNPPRKRFCDWPAYGAAL